MKLVRNVKKLEIVLKDALGLGWKYWKNSDMLYPGNRMNKYAEVSYKS